MSSIISDSTENNDVSSETKELLAAKLQDLLYDLTNSPPPLRSLLSICAALEGEEDDDARDLFVSLNGMEIVVEATKHPAVTPDFLHLACMTYFRMLENNAERTTYFIDNGGLDRCLEIMESHRSSGTLMHLYVSFLAAVFRSLTCEQLAMISPRVCEALIPIIESHKHDASIFLHSSMALNLFLRDEELSSDHSQRITQSVLEGLALHQHFRAAQYAGSDLLSTCVGTELASELLSTHDINTQGPFISEEIAKTVYSSVSRLQTLSFHAGRALKAVQTLYDLSLGPSQRDNEVFKCVLISMNIFGTLINAAKHSSACPVFLHRAGGILCVLLQDSTDRSTKFLSKGGLDCCLEIIQSYMTDTVVVKGYLGVLGMLLFSVTEEQRSSIAERVFCSALQVLEFYTENDYIYSCVCIPLQVSLGPFLEAKEDLLLRAAQATFDGILYHKYHEDAQSHGRDLLAKLVGPECARYLIDHAEMHHCEGEGCSCAA